MLTNLALVYLEYVGKHWPRELRFGQLGEVYPYDAMTYGAIFEARSRPRPSSQSFLNERSFSYLNEQK